MSWLDRIDSGISITTGDSKVFTPLWKPTSKNLDFNISEFNFQNVAGTLVNRGEPKGRKFPIEIYFIGDDNIEKSLEFEESSKDKRAWVISHPYYDDILVHPVSLNFDNNKYNSTKITGVVLETLSDIYPKSTLNQVDTIALLKIECDEDMAQDFATTIPAPKAATVASMDEVTNDQYNASKLIIVDTTDAEDFRGALSEASSAIDVATVAPLMAMKKMQSVLSYPSQFKLKAQNRINQLESNYTRLRGSIASFTDRSSKFLFEGQGGTIISAMSFAASTPEEGDFTNRADVILVIEQITSTYNQYLIDLDSLQTNNNGNEESYIPNAAGIEALARIYNYTLANLLQIAISGKQERSLILSSYSNAIILTHRFYGLEETDQNLENFINQNQIGINEMLEIKTGRKVIYYV